VSDPRRVTGIVIVVLLVLAGGVFVYMQNRAERASIAEIQRSPDRFDNTYVLLEGKVTPAVPRFDGVLIGYTGGFELDDGTGKMSIHYDEGKVAGPTVGAHVVVKARAERPEEASADPTHPPPAQKAALALVAESIEVR
jgi:hypothetical protein